MSPEKNIVAIIWDYDGTLVDTSSKNLNVTREIVGRISGVDPKKYSALLNLENYYVANRKSMNWRELYRDSFGYSEEQTDAAGNLWSEYQLNDNTPVNFFDGIQDVVSSLAKYNQGIVSQNSRNKILEILQESNLAQYFSSIIGYEEVELRKQKPHPEGLLNCIQNLSRFSPGYVLFIGDHDCDIQCAVNANKKLRQKNLDMEIISIGVAYNGAADLAWKEPPDYKVTKAKEILDIAYRLQ